MDLEKLTILRAKNAESHKKIYDSNKNNEEFLSKKAKYSREYYAKNTSYRENKKKKSISQIL